MFLIISEIYLFLFRTHVNFIREDLGLQPHAKARDYRSE